MHINSGITSRFLPVPTRGFRCYSRVCFQCHMSELLVQTNVRCSCRNEEVLCFDGSIPGAGDGDVESLWHEKCDARTSVTTPARITQTTTGNDRDDSCIWAWSAFWKYAYFWESSCSTLLATLDMYKSCMCQPYILSVGYTKSFIGNTSCHGTTAALTNMWAYTYCPNFWSIIGPLANVRVSYTTSSTANI